MTLVEYMMIIMQIFVELLWCLQHMTCIGIYSISSLGAREIFICVHNRTNPNENRINPNSRNHDVCGDVCNFHLESYIGMRSQGLFYLFNLNYKRLCLCMWHVCPFATSHQVIRGVPSLIIMPMPPKIGQFTSASMGAVVRQYRPFIKKIFSLEGLFYLSLTIY